MFTAELKLCSSDWELNPCARTGTQPKPRLGLKPTVCVLLFFFFFLAIPCGLQDLRLGGIENSPVCAKETCLRMLTVAFVCHKENNNNHENNVEWKTFI